MYRLQPSFLKVVLLTAVSLLALGCGSKTAQEHLQAAQESAAAGNPRVAVVEVRNAIQKDPKLAGAHSLLGQLQLAEGDLPKALKALNKAIDLGAEDEATELSLLKTKLGLGQYSAIVGELAEKDELNSQYQVVLAEAYLLAQDGAAAETLYKQNLHLAEGLLGMAKLAFVESDYTRALEYARQATDKDPESADSWLFKGELELTLNDTQAALSSFANARKDPAAEIAARLGGVRAHLMSADLDSADAQVDELIALVKGLPQAHYFKALIRFRQDDLEAAEKALKVVNKHAKNNQQAQYLMGVVKYRQGHLYQADSTLRQVLKRDSGNAAVSKLLASIATQLDQYEEVVELLEEVAPQHSDPQMWAMLGSALLRVGQAEQGTEALQKAVALAPDMAAFRNQLALGLLSSGDQEQAVAELDSAIELGGDEYQSDYLLVMIKTRDGDFAGANQVVDALLVKSPDNAVAYNLRGTIALAQGREDAAEEAFVKATAIDPGYYPAVQNLADIAERRGDHQRSDALLRTLSDEGNERALLARVDKAVRLQKFSQALELIEQAVKRFPESVPAHLGSARLLMATGELVAAERAIDTAVELAGEVPQVLLLQAEIDLRQGNHREAVQVVRKLRTLVARNNDNPQILASVGALQLRTDDLTGARRNLERAVEISATPLIPALISLVKVELLEDNPVKARDYLKQLDELGVAGEEMALLQGEFLLAAKRYDAARAHFTELAEKGSRAATSKLALLAMQGGDYEQVDELLSAWLEKHPNDGAMQRLLASAHVQLGQSDDAKVRYEAMLPSDDPVVLNNLAWIYMTEGNPKALELARKAYNIAPRNPDIADTLGWILVNQGEVREGLAFLRDSARVRPDNASVQFHLGVAYVKLGQRASAVKALEKALDLGNFSEAPEAKRMLETLQSS